MNCRIVILVLMASALYSMDNGEKRSLLNDTKEKMLTQFTESDWKEKVNGLTLELSNAKFNSIKELSDVCKPSPSSAVPVLFPYETLTKITLTHNNLCEIQADSFTGFKNLSHLDVSHNKLKVIDFGSFFAACPRLKHLDVSHNAIATVAWSLHPAWTKSTASLPIINCIGNAIVQADRDWLKKKYIEKEVEFYRSTTMGEYSIRGGFSGTVLCGGGIGGVVTIITENTLYMAAGFPIGCMVGTLAGLGLAEYDSRKQDEDGERMRDRIYFEKGDVPRNNIESDRELGIRSWLQCRY